ncbi:MAG TPA: ferredoxin [Acidimicrobiales bacterium]|nr:ferredoxin [Acidimicrobiales bacterium]
MQVSVDPAKCQGHNRCARIAPDLFTVDELGTAHVVGDGHVPAGRERVARLAADNCPEYAVSASAEGDSK